jgi:hypothetical protein
MKRHLKGVCFPVALMCAAAVVAITSCGTEEPGTNGPSEEYFPAGVGQTWIYDTYNVTRDPAKTAPLYTHVSVEYLSPRPGEKVEPIWVTKYAKGDNGQYLRLNQAGYWVNKDIFFKYEYFNYDTDRFDVRGYHYLSEYRDPVIGTYYYNSQGQTVPFTYFATPFTLNDTWDVLNYNNPNPETNPTVFTNVEQKDYFGLLRDMDNDGQLDTMDISIVGKVVDRALIETDMGTLNCFQIELTQTLVFHLSSQGDMTDVSTTTYWIAPNYGIAKVIWNADSNYLDEIEMQLRTWWFVK